MNTHTTNHAACDTFKRILTVFLLVLTTVAFGQISTPDDEKQQALQNERQRRLNDEQLRSLIRLRQTFVDNVQDTQMLLAELSGTAQKHFQLLESLLTNDDGKRIANSTEWFMSYRILKENPVVRIEEITHRLKAVTSIQKDLQADEDAMYIGFLPSAVTQEEVGRYKFWAEDRLERLNKQHSNLKEILDKTAGTSDVSQLITLDKANQQYDAKWLEVLRDSDILGKQLAMEESKEILVKASHMAMLEKAVAEAERIKLQAEAEKESQKLDYEFKLMRQRQETERERYKAEKERDDLLAELERFRQDDAVTRTVQDIKAGLKRDSTLEDAIRLERIAKAKTVEVQQILAPFIAKGYYQPGLYKPAFESEPISLSKLNAFGALEPSVKGLDKLIEVATKKTDKERPRWPYSKFLTRLRPEEITRIKQAQAYLIELGDVMVELGMLAP